MRWRPRGVGSYPVTPKTVEHPTSACAAHRDVTIIMMRTTLNLPEDVYEFSRSLAALKRISLGDAVGELVRNGLKPAVRINARKAFPSFVLTKSAKPITLEQTLAAEDEL